MRKRHQKKTSWLVAFGIGHWAAFYAQEVAEVRNRDFKEVTRRVRILCRCHLFDELSQLFSLLYLHANINKQTNTATFEMGASAGKLN